MYCHLAKKIFVWIFCPVEKGLTVSFSRIGSRIFLSFFFVPVGFLGENILKKKIY